MKIYIISICFLLLAHIAYAQNKGSVIGIVTDKETGKSLPNTEVLVVETSQGTD